jgi:cell wall-associated NlpC family hydrolase
LRLSSTIQQRARPALCLAAASVALAGLGASAASADPTVASKQVEAQQVLAQVDQLDRSLSHAIQAYDAANERLNQVKADLRANQHRLVIARASLKRAQATLARRLVDLYTSGRSESTLEVLLGADNLDGVLSTLDAQDRAGQQDAIIVRDVARFQHETERRQQRLDRARAYQAQLVVERAAAQHSIEQQLASRRQLLSSVRSEIERLRAAEQARQAELQRQAEARLAAQQQAAQRTVLSTIAAPPPAMTTSPNPPPPAPSSGGVVGIAMHYLGIPYVWGGSSPSGFDCSGFVMYVYAQVGISLPHYTVSQYGMGSAVSRSQLQPGDVLFFDGLGHNGIYIGGNQFIHAPHTGDVVKISSISGWYASTYVGARRF